MSSKLHRGGIPSEPAGWRSVAPLDQAPLEPPYPAARYAPSSEIVTRAPDYNNDPARTAYQQGVQAGQATCREEMAAQSEAMNGRLARSIEELSSLRPRLRREAEEDVVALAIAIARRILHRELTVAPEALLGIVKAALEKIETREVTSVRVCRTDASQVEQFLEKMGIPKRIEVIGDPALPPGSAILDSSRGMLDASVQTQLSEIERGFADLVRRG